jgi:hypothetical protein
VATSCESAQMAMGKMLEGIPFTMQTTDKENIQGKKYVSPNLNLQVADRLRWDYIADIEESDILTFFLHGNNSPASYHYYGENKERTSDTYIAFKPDLLLSSKAKIISGVCCWGARFIGYPKVQSTLLTAMYSSTLLFMGSSRCAAGFFDDALSNISNIEELKNLSVVSVVSCGALLCFLFFNCFPAKIFMGDTGSLALGSLIASVSIFSGLELYIPILGVVFVVSAVSVILQVAYYKLTKKRIFLMAPLHHHFEKKGVHEVRITFCYSLVSLIVGVVVILLNIF